MLAGLLFLNEANVEARIQGTANPVGDIIERALIYKVTSVTVQTFRELLTQRPFKPFRMIMSSGQSYEVRHPEMALLTKTDMLVGVNESEEGVPAEFKICSLLHVTAVEPVSAGSGSAG